MYEKIEQTENYLNEKYGAPIEYREGNMTIKHINLYLNSFKNMIKAFTQALDYVEYEDVELQIELLCEYAKNAEYIDLDNIAKRLNYLIKMWKNDREKNAKNYFINLLDDLAKNYDKINSNCDLIINYFAYHIKCNQRKTNIKADKHNYTLSDNYFNRNPYFEDNNL